MKALTQRTLRVFSVLEDYRAGSADILDAILPFFEPILAQHVGRILNQEEFSREVRETYRWNFTGDIVEELIPRFEQKGWIKEVSSTGEVAAYQIMYEASKVAEFGENHTDIGEVLANVARQFREFISDLSPLTAFDKSIDELMDVLVEWLISIDAYSEDILFRHASGTIQRGEILRFDLEIEDSSTLSSEEKYLCARYVKHLFDINSPFTSALCNIASIGLLTEVVQDFQKPITAVDETDLAIYLDAPVALDLLGLSGNAAAGNIRPIIRKLQEIGATVRIFRASVNELRQALEAILKRAPAERTGATADAIRRNEVMEAYVREIGRNPDSALKELSVRVVDRTLDQFPNDHKYFPSEEYDDLFARMTWHLEISRREHDTTVTALTMRMRRGHQSSDIFQTRHVLITRNGALSQSARRFCIDRGLIDKNAIGPAIHQRQLATAVWLRTGLQDSEQEDVPRRYLLAACERVLELKRNVVDQVRLTASNLTPEKAQQLDLLLTQDRSTQMLMDKTLGISQVISSTNISGLIDAMKQSLVADIEKQTKSEVRKIETKARDEINRETEARKVAEREANKLHQSLSMREREDRDVMVKLVDEVNYSIFILIRLTNAILAIFVLAIFCLPVYASFANGAFRVLSIMVAAAIAAVLAFFQLLDRPLGLRVRIGNWGYRRLCQLAEKRGLKNRLDNFGVTSSNGYLNLVDSIDWEESGS